MYSAAQAFEDQLSISLQESNPELFEREDTKRLSTRGKCAYILVMSIARRNNGWVPIDPQEFLREASLPINSVSIKGIRQDLEELQDAGLLENRDAQANS